MKPIRHLSAWALALAATTFSTAAIAQHEHEGMRWRGDIARFHEQDWHMWRGGHWINGPHDGRVGWWWVVGDFWYFYPAPVYPYPNPWEPPLESAAPVPEGAVPAPPATRYWYYCDASKMYYPYAPTCPGGWKQVPATPNDTK